MESKYFIVFKDLCLPLFRLDYEYKNEGPAVIDFRIRMTGNRDLAAEDIIRDLYAKFRGRHDSLSNPVDLLGILLANGCSLQLQNDQGNFDLCKDHFPISFEAKSAKKTIRIGDYYRTSVSNLGEQFIYFGQWMDRLTGVNGMHRHMICQFISAGLSIVAREPDKETILISVNALGDILGGDETLLTDLVTEEP